MTTPPPLEERSQLRQDADTPLTALETAFGTALYLYARSDDSVENATVGQDYVAYRYGKSDLAFAVCDGVGQSFVGELAARILGDGLIDWLWDIDAPSNADSFADAAREALDKLAETSAKEIANYQLPPHLPPMVIQALEMQRQYSSESMFVAGRLALADPQPWIALCWLGDSPVAAIDIDGKLMDLGPKGHTSERWNATTGVKGSIHTWVGSAHRVARVAGYTDGLGLAHAPTDAELARLMSGWKIMPPADDASLFDIRLAPSPQTIGEPVTPVYQPDDTRPIVITDEQRTPVTALEPIEKLPPARQMIEGWRPLTEKARSLEERANQALPGAPSSLDGLSPQQQMRVWQQAALLGLTSAALAMLMLERLITEQENKGAK